VKKLALVLMVVLLIATGVMTGCTSGKSEEEKLLEELAKEPSISGTYVCTKGGEEGLGSTVDNYYEFNSDGTFYLGSSKGGGGVGEWKQEADGITFTAQSFGTNIAWKGKVKDNTIVLDDGSTWVKEGKHVKEETTTPEATVTVERTTQLTFDDLRMSCPVWSPDSNKILYQVLVSMSPFNSDIWVMNADGGNKTRLTNGPNLEFETSWSPDGGKIVYLSGTPGQLDIWVMNVDGSNKKRLTFEPGYKNNLFVVPDGTKIVYHVYGGLNGPPNAGIWIMNADGTGKKQLMRPDEGRNLSISSTGEIAYEKNMGNYNWDIWAMELDSSNKRQLTTEPSSQSHPLFSPDGSKIAYEVINLIKERENGIWVMNSDGSNKTRLSTAAGTASWNPSGKRIAFLAGTPYKIFVINMDGTGRTQLTFGAAYDFDPSWSPDGTRIAYQAAIDPEYGASNIWVLSLKEH